MLAIPVTILFAQGWRRRLIALLAGAIGALAMAPFDFLPAMAVPMTVAVWLIDGSIGRDPIGKDPTRSPARPSAWRRWALPLAARQAFWAGWWWGFGYFLGGLWWLGAAFLVEAEEFAWALPLGVVGVPALLAIFPAIGFLCAHWLWAPGASRIFALAAGLSLAEWLRGHILTGFPWNGFGMALGDHLVPAQLASVVGVYGLTTLAILVFAAPAAMISWSPVEIARGRFGQGVAPPRVSWLPLASALVTLAAIWGFGALRLAGADPGEVAGVRLRIMQPNLLPDEKFHPENRNSILAQYFDLSRGAAGVEPLETAGITALVWPESAFPFILARDADALARMAALLPEGTVLVTGAAREQYEPSADSISSSRVDYFNAIQVVDAGTIGDTYDKVHLVPFGEYLPLRSWLEPLGLHHFVHVPGGFEPGAGRRLLAVPGLPKVAPLVCYEAIFSGEVLPPGTGVERPGLLLNVTNDGWFGTTAGPYQHFAQARLRAIEEGLPLVRAASSGISAIVDPYGRVRGELPLGVAGTLDGNLPQAIAAPIFARFPLAITALCWIATLAGALVGRPRRL